MDILAPLPDSTVNTRSDLCRIIWYLPCLVLLIYGAALRWPTLNASGNFASGRLAYSDVVVFYSADNPVPYLERDIEYPVLTGLTIWLTAFMPDGKPGYFLANAVLLSAALLGCLAFLLSSGPEVRAGHFALAPGLAFYGVLNWDALGVLGIAAAMYFTKRRRFDLAGACLAFGACAKLFPGFLLPILWAEAVRGIPQYRQTSSEFPSMRELFSHDARQLLLAFGVVTLALNLPVAMLNFRGWSHFVRFQGGRAHNLDSIWHFLPPIPDRAESAIFALIFLGGVAWLALRIYYEGVRWDIASLLTLVLFLLPTKVYSPQYDLWLLPLLAFVACPLWLWATFVLADAFYYWAIFTFHYASTGGSTWFDANTMSNLLGASVWSRELALAALLIWGLKHLSSTGGHRVPESTEQNNSAAMPSVWQPRRPELTTAHLLVFR